MMNHLKFGIAFLLLLCLLFAEAVTAQEASRAPEVAELTASATNSLSTNPDPRRLPDGGARIMASPAGRAAVDLRSARGFRSSEIRTGQRQGTLAGRVVDAGTGSPMSAAQVLIPALNIGTITGADGNYLIIDVPDGTHLMEVRMIGYNLVRREVTVGSEARVQVDFALVQQALALDEIVVTGTPGGTQRRAIGNVVERVDAGAIREVSSAQHVEDVLSSRVPGVIVHSGGGGGMVGTDAGQIRVRGSSSLGLPNDPIVFVDGIRINSDRTHAAATSTGTGAMSRLNDINPEDIESIEVIKGPAASTLYGTEASNGVIQIITKRGAAGDAVFNASVEMGTSWIPDPAKEVGVTWGLSTAGELIRTNIYQAGVDRGNPPPLDYGAIRRFDLSVQGGTPLIRYFGSINRSNDRGLVSSSSDERTRARMTLSINVSDRLSLNLSGAYMQSETERPGDIWSTMVRGGPRFDIEAGGVDPLLRGFAVRPPEAWAEGMEDITGVQRSTWTAEVAYNPREWLRSRLVVGADVGTETRNAIIFREEGAPRGTWGNQGLGRVANSKNETQTQTVDYSATARFRMTDQLTGATSVGMQYYRNETTIIAATGEEFASRPLTTLTAAVRNNSSGEFIENSTVGVFVQQELALNDRLFVTPAVRADDNSAFGSEFELAVYPKISATWVLSEEPFWGIDALDQFRVRGAWGAAGMQPDAFAAQRLYLPVIGSGDAPGLVQGALGNPELGPERGEELEVGFDAAFLNNRVSVAWTQYWKTTKDAIVPSPVPPSVGFPGFQLVNAGQVSNWGTELSLQFDLVNRASIEGGLGVEFATMNSRVDDLGGLDVLSFRRSRHAVVGFPLSGQHEIMILSAEFRSGNSGAVQNVMCDGGIPSGKGFLPGGPAVPCADAPLVYWGKSAEPTWQVTMTPTLRLGQNLRLFATVSALGGNMVTQEFISAKQTSWRNTRAANAQDDVIIQAYRGTRREPLGFHDAGFARLRDLSAQYVLPAGWASRFGASRASVTVAGRNLALLWQEAKTVRLGSDPELVGDPEKQRSWFEDMMGATNAGAMPVPANVSVNVRVTF